MKKILLLLATMLAFTACQRDAQPSIPEPDDASGNTRQVALDLEGDVSDPLNEFARALELEPGTSGGALHWLPSLPMVKRSMPSVLSPRRMGLEAQTSFRLN